MMKTQNSIRFILALVLFTMTLLADARPTTAFPPSPPFIIQGRVLAFSPTDEPSDALGLPGVTVRVYDGESDALLDTLVSDAAGAWEFNEDAAGLNLPDWMTFFIEQALPAGYERHSVVVDGRSFEFDS
jgi:hypothetical protein